MRFFFSTDNFFPARKYGISMQNPHVFGPLKRQFLTVNPEVETTWVAVEGEIETKDQPVGG